MKGANGYLAVVLDEQTMVAISPLMMHPNEYGTHVTIAYRPSPEVYAKYKHLVGTRVEFQMTELYADSKGQAIRVSGIPSENEAPHITLSCNDGIRPAYSNELLRKSKRCVKVNMTGHGTVQWIGF